MLGLCVVVWLPSMPPIENEPACELAVDSVSRLDKQATVRRYGRAAFSFDMFEAPERYRWCETSCAPDGAVAFRRIYRSDIIIGEPLVPEEHYGQAFEEFVQTRPVGTCVVGYCCSDTFMNAALQKGAAAAQLISEIEFDPRQWSADAGAAGEATTEVFEYGTDFDAYRKEVMKEIRRQEEALLAGKLRREY